jgi:hypothetical protein
MDQAAKDRIKREIEDHVRTLLPDGAVRRVEWPSHHDDPHIEPGELLPSLILTEPPGRRRGRPEPGQAIKKFQAIHGPGLKQFRYELPRRWPEIQNLGIGFEDASGHSRGGIVMALDDQSGEAADSDITHVMVRLKPPELEIVDTLITAGIANSRAEAIRWALARISERPAYTQLREHTRDIQKLTTEF